MIRTGTYKDLNGQNVRVRRTATGYVVTHADGRVESMSLTGRRPGQPLPQSVPVHSKAARA